MKIFLNILILFFFNFKFSQTVPTSGAFTTDETDFFVSGNKVNDSQKGLIIALLS